MFESEKALTEKAIARGLFVSPGNKKMGGVPSVSLPAITTCRPDAPCFKACYAAALERRYKETAGTDLNNYLLYKARPEMFFNQLKAHFMLSSYFRMHVSGDIPDPEYFARLAETAAAVPSCHVLIFTKKYYIVNDFVTAGGTIPENLVIIYSDWIGGFMRPDDNPHGFPVCKLKRKDDDAHGLPVCGGNCTACICAGIGCWNVKRGDAFYINMH